MRRKFKGKKKYQISKIIKLVIIFIIIYLFFKFFNIRINFQINDSMINTIINDNNYLSDNNIINRVLKNNIHSKINNPSSLLATSFYISNKKQTKNNIKEVSITKSTNDKPIVYLYNSHQSETYSMEYMEDYNVNPNVLMVSHMIQERLNNLGINTLVEENNISKYLKDNDMKYYQSYEASRHFLLDVMEKYDSIKLYIDIHRDAVTHEVSTVNINGIDCAKIMFVVGLEHDNYINNLENMNHLNDMIKEKYPTLTRGVLQKEGKNVNGIYNQDLGSNIMLIEIGGNYNNIEEVLNTIDLITPIIGEYINEKR